MNANNKLRETNKNKINKNFLIIEKRLILFISKFKIRDRPLTLTVHKCEK